MIDLIIESYTQLNMDNINIQKEYLLLKERKNATNEKKTKWDYYSDEEKHLQRIYQLSIFNKMYSYREENKTLFKLEESLIDLLEAVYNCLNRLNQNNEISSHSDMIRVKSMLWLLKERLNQSEDLRLVDDLYFETIKFLIYDCFNGELQDYFVKKSGLLFLKCKIESSWRIISSGV